MSIYFVKIARVSFRVLFVSATVALLGLVSMAHVLPIVDREAYVVRGGSMSPAIPVGSVVIIRHVDPEAVQVGDVVTFHGTNDSVITHRVVGLPTETSTGFQTKGDASDEVDPFGVPAEALIGTVDVLVPGAGAVLLTLGTTVGVVAALALLGGLAMAVWFMDELAQTVVRSASLRTRAEAY
jgi:signal peptidase I